MKNQSPGSYEKELFGMKKCVCEEQQPRLKNTVVEWLLIKMMTKEASK